MLRSGFELRIHNSRPDPIGAWLSLVEHCFREAVVGGSNPLAPTNFLIMLAFLAAKKL